MFCEFLTYKRACGILIECCTLTDNVCFVDPRTGSAQECTRRTWALDHLPQQALTEYSRPGDPGQGPSPG